MNAAYTSNNEGAQVRECIETTFENASVTAAGLVRLHGVLALEVWLGRVLRGRAGHIVLLHVFFYVFCEISVLHSSYTIYSI